jgi:hypothetical protein
MDGAVLAVAVPDPCGHDEHECVGLARVRVVPGGAVSPSTTAVCVRSSCRRFSSPRWPSTRSRGPEGRRDERGADDEVESLRVPVDRFRRAFAELVSSTGLALWQELRLVAEAPPVDAAAAPPRRNGTLKERARQAPLRRRSAPESSPPVACRRPRFFPGELRDGRDLTAAVDYHRARSSSSPRWWMSAGASTAAFRCASTKERARSASAGDRGGCLGRTIVNDATICNQAA